MTPRPRRPIPVRYGSRYGSAPSVDARRCPVCAAPLPSARARYCADACKQRAYRLRLADAAAGDTAGPAAAGERPGDPDAHMVYECPTCDARHLGERRCPDCHHFCRKLGPGGACPHCDEPVLLAELLGAEVLP